VWRVHFQEEDESGDNDAGSVTSNGSDDTVEETQERSQALHDLENGSTSDNDHVTEQVVQEATTELSYHLAMYELVAACARYEKENSCAVC